MSDYPANDNGHTNIIGDAVRGSHDPAATLRAAGVRGLRRQAGYMPPSMSNEYVVIQLDLFGSYRLLEFKSTTLDYLYDQWQEAAESVWDADLAVSAQLPDTETDIAECTDELKVIEKLIRLYGGLVPDYDAFSLERWEEL